jgi:hypothetical protein
VGRGKEFNLSLDDKWRLRLLEESNDLWCKVLKVKYESWDGQVDGGGNKTSS